MFLFFCYKFIYINQDFAGHLSLISLPVSSITDFIEKPDLVVSLVVTWLLKLAADIFVKPLAEKVIDGFLHCICQWTAPSASMRSLTLVQLKLEGFII
jgi:hypothetical protein